MYAYLHNNLDTITVNFHHPVSIHVVKVSPVDVKVVGVVEHVSHENGVKKIEGDVAGEVVVTIEGRLGAMKQSIDSCNRFSVAKIPKLAVLSVILCSAVYLISRGTIQTCALYIEMYVFSTPLPTIYSDLISCRTKGLSSNFWRSMKYESYSDKGQPPEYDDLQVSSFLS